MTENILNPDGLLVVPGPSNLEVDDEKMQLAETDKEDDLLRESDNEEDVGDSFPLTQRTPKDKRNKEQNHRDVPNSRKRRYSQTLSAEEKIEHAEKAIKSLKRHTERGTCPSSLQYRARARINADTDHGEDKEPHPFHVKSTWNPPVQPSVALESYLEEVKIQLAEIKLTTPKNNLNSAERDALKALKRNTKINFKKADKGTTTVVLSVEQKIREGQNQLNNEEHYRPLTKPMVVTTLAACEISYCFQTFAYYFQSHTWSCSSLHKRTYFC